MDREWVALLTGGFAGFAAALAVELVRRWARRSMRREKPPARVEQRWER